MTMLSSRVGEAEAAALQGRADRLAVERSELLREALHRHLPRLQSAEDTRTWEEVPLTEAESALARVADWGPAEEWSDWPDAAG